MDASPAPIALAALMQLLFIFGLSAWGRWVARRNEGSGFFRFASYLPWMSMALIVTGTAIAVMLLMRAFDAIRNAESAYKATILAEGISEAMNASAMFLIPGYALLFFAIVAFAVGTLKSRPAAR